MVEQRSHANIRLLSLNKKKHVPPQHWDEYQVLQSCEWCNKRCNRCERRHAHENNAAIDGNSNRRRTSRTAVNILYDKDCRFEGHGEQKSVVKINACSENTERLCSTYARLTLRASHGSTTCRGVCHTTFRIMQSGFEIRCERKVVNELQGSNRKNAFNLPCHCLTKIVHWKSIQCPHNDPV